ncbi:MAG: hypothetical protein WD669_06170 [Pirellulales bacterium]
MPYLLEPMDCPVCQQCGRPMAFIAQVPLKTPLQLSRRFDMAYVFMCCEYHDPGICDSYDPYSGANAVIFQKGHQGHFGCKENAQFPEYGFELEEFEEPVVDTTDPSFHNIPPDPATNAAAAEHGILFGLYQDDFFEPPELVGSKTKLGGVPCWVQNNDTVPCQKCGGEVDLLAQIDSAIVWPEMNMHHARRAMRYLVSDAGTAYRESDKHIEVHIADDGYEIKLVPAGANQPAGGISFLGDPGIVTYERSEDVFPFGSGGVAYVFKCRNECSHKSGLFMWQTT